MTTPALQAALAAYSSETPAEQPEAPALETPTSEPAPELPAEPPAEPEAPPGPPPLSDLEKIVKQRADERTAAERAAAERAELQQLREQVAALANSRQGGGLDVKAFVQDPLGTLRSAGLDDQGVKDVLRGLTTGILNPDVLALQRQVNDLSKKNQSSVDPAIAQRLEAIEQMHRDTIRNSAEAGFDAIASKAEQFPYLSRLSREERIQYGWDVVGRYQAAGIPVTDEQIASAAEQELKSKIERLSGLHGADAQAAAQKAAAQSGATAKAPGASPVTLSADLAANAAMSSPETLEERIALARKQLEARRANGQ